MSSCAASCTSRFCQAAWFAFLISAYSPTADAESLSRSAATARSCCPVRSTHQPRARLPRLLRQHADRRTTHFGSAVLPPHSAITTGMELPCQHILIHATRLRSPPLYLHPALPEAEQVAQTAPLLHTKPDFEYCTDAISRQCIDRYAPTGPACCPPDNINRKSR